MGLVDDIKALLSNEEPEPTEPTPGEPTPTPTPEPTPGEPTPTPTPTEPTEPTEPGEPTPGESFTREEVTAMLEAQRVETVAAFAEIVKEFKGDGTPPVGGPAQPNETSGDFSQWNAEIAAIESET